MRITLAGSTFEKSVGGITTYNRFLASKLLLRGHKLQIIAPDIVAGVFREDNCLFVPGPVPERVADEPKWARSMFRAILSFDPDVIISSNHSTLSSLFPSFSRKRICISISHFYDGIIAKTAAIYPGETDWIVCISQSGKDFLDHYINRCCGNTVVLLNSIEDLLDFDRIFSEKVLAQELVVCFPGGSNRIKRADLFAKIVCHCSRFENVSFKWLGDARSHAVRLRGNKRVEFTGQIMVDAAQEIIASSHVLVLPSRGEGCPMALLEAMRSGTVPLVSACPSAMRDIVRTDYNGYVIKSNNAAEYIARIEELRKDVNMRNRLACGARETFLSKLNPEQWIESLERLFTPRNGCARGDKDEFKGEKLLRWQSRPGRWYRPTASYLRQRLGLLDRRGICDHMGRKLHACEN